MAMGADPVRLHTIATPEGVELPLAVPPAGERLGAFLFDFGLVVGGTLAVWFLALFADIAEAGALGFIAALLATFLLRNFYFILCETLWGGQTPGKRAFKLRVVARAGGPLTAEAVVARNLMRELELFLPMQLFLGAAFADAGGGSLLLSSLWIFAFAALPLLNRDRLRCGDLLAGTLVVKLPVPALLPDLATTPPSSRLPVGLPPGPLSILPAVPAPPARPEHDLTFTREQLDHYGIRELQVLEDLLRRFENGMLGNDVLTDVTWRIQKKIGWNEQVSDPLAFLDAFYRAQRARLEQKLLFGQRQERKKER